MGKHTEQNERNTVLHIKTQEPCCCHHLDVTSTALYLSTPDSMDPCISHLLFFPGSSQSRPLRRPQELIAELAHVPYDTIQSPLLLRHLLSWSLQSQPAISPQKNKTKHTMTCDETSIFCTRHNLFSSLPAYNDSHRNRIPEQTT